MASECDSDRSHARMNMQVATIVALKLGIDVKFTNTVLQSVHTCCVAVHVAGRKMRQNSVRVQTEASGSHR